MNSHPTPPFRRTLLVAALLAGAAFATHADVITDTNLEAGKLIAEAKPGTPPAIRTMAIVQTAIYDAVNAITQRDPLPRGTPRALRGASVEAAVAAAQRGTLAKLLPAQQAAVETAYQAALARVAEGPAKAAGIAVGEQAAAAVLAARADDGAAVGEAYRPSTAAGAYVPTVVPAVTQWPQRRPWLMTSAAQFRPAAPPALTSETWARDYNEVQALGGRGSTRRSAEQTEIARFWDYSLPAIYHGVVRSVAEQPGRDLTRNARLFATVAQAMDDAAIGVFDAKYHYNFWRPATAIRNGDTDGHEATQRDAAWSPLIDTPMHPEYPSAHSALAAAVAAVIEADVGRDAMPVLATSSPTAKGATRRWQRLDDFVREVGEARIVGGIHYRSATEAGAALGRQVGELAARRQGPPSPTHIAEAQ